MDARNTNENASRRDFLRTARPRRGPCRLGRGGHARAAAADETLALNGGPKADGRQRRRHQVAYFGDENAGLVAKLLQGPRLRPRGGV